MSHKPASYTEPELLRFGVDIVDFCAVVLQCRQCGEQWTPRVPVCGRLPKHYWVCPNGCNRPPENPQPNSEATLPCK